MSTSTTKAIDLYTRTHDVFYTCDVKTAQLLCKTLGGELIFDFPLVKAKSLGLISTKEGCYVTSNQIVLIGYSVTIYRLPLGWAVNTYSIPVAYTGSSSEWAGGNRLRVHTTPISALLTIPQNNTGEIILKVVASGTTSSRIVGNKHE